MSHRYITLVIVTLLVAGAAHGQYRPESGPVAIRQDLQADPLLQIVARNMKAEDSRLDAVWYHEWEDGAWTTTARTLFVYNGTFRTEQWEYVHDGAGLVNDSRTLLTYDGQQRLQSSTLQQWDAGSENFLPYSRQRYFYDGGSRVATDVFFDTWDSVENDFVPQDRDTYTLGTIGDGQYITSGQSFAWSGGVWMPVERFDVAQVGSDVVYTNQIRVGGDWVNESRSIYLNLTIDELYAHFEQLMADLEEVHGAYLGLRLPDGLQQTWNGSEWQDESRQVTVRYYDPFTGAVIRSESTNEDWEDDEWVAGLRQVTSFEVYNGSSRPDSLWFQFYMGDDEWMTFIQEAYEYDEDGRLLEIYLDGLDLFGTGGLRTWTHLVWSGTSTSAEDPHLVVQFNLEAAYPNPFNPTTTIPFTLDRPADVRITIYDAVGRQVMMVTDRRYPHGRHSETFDATHLASGTYFVRLSVEGRSLARAVTLMK